MRTGKRPGKRWVQVDDHPGEAIEEGRREQVHPAGLHDQVGAGVGDLRRQRSVVAFAGSARIVRDGLPKRPHRPVHGWHTGGCGPLGRVRSATVDHDEHNLGVERAVSAGVEDGLQVGAGPRRQDDETRGHRQSPTSSTSPVSDSTSRPITGWPEADAASASSASIATIRPMPMFHVRNDSLSGTSPSSTR